MSLCKKALPAAAGALALTLVLTSCGSAGPTESGGAAADSASLWALTTGDQPVIESSVENWNSAHQDATIATDFFASDAYKTKIRTAIGAKQGPTLIYNWGGGVLASYAESGSIIDLSSFIAENPELKTKYIPSVLNNATVDGKTYGLPMNKLNPVNLYYNKALFEQAGVQPPKTWDELLALVPVFNNIGIAPLALGGQSQWPELMYLEYLVNRIGGPDVYQRILDGTPGAWSDPAVIQATTMIQELVDAGGFINGFASTSSTSGSELALMYTGKAAMVVQLAAQYQTVKTGSPEFIADDQLGYVPFPQVEGGKGDPSYVVGNPSNLYAVSADATAAQQQTAKDYMRSGMLDEENIADMIAHGGVPPVTGIEAELAKSPDSKFLEFTYGLASSASQFELSWDQGLAPSQADALLNNLQQVFLKQITPQQFADNMNATLGQQ